MTHISNQADNHNSGELIPSNRWGEDIIIDSELVRNNLSEIKKEIAPCKPRIIGVTKYFGLDAIKKGYEAGLRNFGESRVMEAIEKIKLLPNEIRENSTLHFIGHLQTNKVEKAVEYFDYIHSVDSLKLATAISKAACHLNKRERIFLQVNNAEEVQKSGYTKGRLREDFSEILKLESIDIVGLMNMAPIDATEEELHRLFGDVREFKTELEREFKVTLPELSMGMSNDYKIAVEEGATVIRIGRKLFK